MAELLFEILGEEMPAGMAPRGADALGKAVAAGLDKAGLAFETLETHWTPRRIALHVTGLPVQQADVEEERRGPREDAPQKALEGFMRGAGLSSLEEAEVRDTPKGRFYFHVQRIQGRATAEVLPGILMDAMRGLRWDKSMRWGRNDFAWVRPIHSLLGLFEGQVLAGSLDLGQDSLPFGKTTRGHRFLAPAAFEVSDFADYLAKLQAAQVVLKLEARKAQIQAQASELAQEVGAQLVQDTGLLAEVAGLVEWPLALRGAIETRFMALPQEVLTTSMRSHQKYFALRGEDGALAPYFITVTNGISGDAVRNGNERVLRSRLADAEFFWQEDLKSDWDALQDSLGAVTFQAGLGSLKDKAERVALLAGELAKELGTNRSAAEEAGRYLKSDLVTHMVGEFPELQGLMGGYYARERGLSEEVAQAIAEHYQPQGPNDACPFAQLSMTLALADKLDTLVGFWRLDKKPTGSKDPFGLRRTALGIIRIIRENNLDIDLVFFIGQADLGYKNLFENTGDNPKLYNELSRFFMERLSAQIKSQDGGRGDVLMALAYTSLRELENQAAIKMIAGPGSFKQKSAAESGRSYSGTRLDLVYLVKLYDLFLERLDTPSGAGLLDAYSRASHFVRDFKGVQDETEVSVPIHKVLKVTHKRVEDAVKLGDYETALENIFTSQESVRDFIDSNQILGLEDTPLKLAALNEFVQAVDLVVDLSKLES